MRRILAILLVLMPTGRIASPQGMPLGPEFRVNTHTTQVQASPSVAFDSSGNFVVVWNSNLQDGSLPGIYAQRFGGSGGPLGSEFRVNTYTTGDQRLSSVACDASGGFVVSWTSYLQDGSGWGVFGQRYGATGAPLGGEFRVNTFTTDYQGPSAVSADLLGNFVVVWDSRYQDGSSWGIFGQRYASSGAPLGDEFRVNTYTTKAQLYSSVASDPAGTFVVVWQSVDQDGPSGIFGQRYNSSGTALGPEFRVNADTTMIEFRPAVASDAAGNFVVVWQEQNSGGLESEIVGQRFSNSGTALGPEFRVNTSTTGEQGPPSIASDASGNFVIVWRSPQDGFAYGIFGQRFANSGAPLGTEFLVNTYTTGSQERPAVAADPLGNFIVTWDSAGQDGSTLGIYGQRYNLILPVELLQFAVE